MKGKYRFRGLERRSVRPVLFLALLLFLLPAVLLPSGCSRPSEFPADDAANQANQRNLPFHDNAAKAPGDGNGGDASAKADRAARAANGPPFQDLTSAPDLPAGTLVTVRLEKEISSARLDDGDTFAAEVDEPVFLDGKMAVPRGAAVTGRIESAHASDAGHGHGYIRLTLDAITIAGKKVPLRTSSLFVRGSAGEVSSSALGQDETGGTPTVTRLQKGRRLTFRLSATLPLHRQETVSSGGNHFPGSE